MMGYSFTLASDVASSVSTLIIALGVLFVALVLAGMPGRIAAKRDHPNLSAIRVLGWFGLLIFPCWIVAIIWALTNPVRR